MIRTQVYIPDDLYREMKLLAITEGVNPSQLIRDGLRDVIAKKAKKPARKGSLKNFIGALTYGPKDLSTRIDDIYK